MKFHERRFMRWINAVVLVSLLFLPTIPVFAQADSQEEPPYDEVAQEITELLNNPWVDFPWEVALIIEQYRDTVLDRDDQLIATSFLLTTEALNNWASSLVAQGDSSGVIIVRWVYERLKVDQLRLEGGSTRVKHEDRVYGVAISPDGQLVLSASRDKTARLWDARTGEELRVFEGHDDTVIGVAFSPNGQQALSSSADSTVRLWDIPTGEELQVFEGHTDLVSSVAFSPDGQQALSGSNDQTMRLWDVATGEELHVFEGHEGSVFSVAFSPDGQQVLSGSFDDTMRLWDIETGKTVRTFSDSLVQIAMVAFSPDGQFIISGSEEMLRLWDVETGKLLHTFFGHRDTVWGVVFSPDGQLIISGSWDGSLRLWGMAEALGSN